MIEKATIVISGVHSDPDPSPGVGIARSLRDAFPDAYLTAVDYSTRSSGLHHPVFDAVLLQAVWAELDLPTYVSQIHQHLSKNSGCWISGLDVETEWLAANLGEHPRLLIPCTAAQQMVRKPVLAAAHSLQMHVPEFLPATAPPTELHALGRHSGWHLWVKGKYHEAYPAYSFTELHRQIRSLESHWPIEDIFVQQHVPGLERSITFASYNGRLIEAVEVEKRSITSQGKTWAAAVTEAPIDAIERLASLLMELRWTGGGEVEFVRDSTGEDWLIDFNPRFPAYIYGVTLCGHNLPASLVGAALGIEFASRPDPAQQFIRVVQEIPVRQELPLPRLVENAGGLASAGKHPSFQPALVRRLRGVKDRNLVRPYQEASTPPKFLIDWRSPPSTPLRFRDYSVARTLLESLAGTLGRCLAKPQVLPAFSVKTDPNPELARSFVARKWWAEVISMREMDWALSQGFEASQIVFNGPAVVDLTSSGGHRVAAAFADSLEAFQILLESPPCDVIGLRLRSGAITSRFGVDLTDFRAFNRAVQLIRRNGIGRRLGLHVHFASDVYGPVRWRDFVEQALVWADALAEASGGDFSVFDLGGGWDVDDYQNLFMPMLPDLQRRIARFIPSVDKIILEPGKAVATETGWLVTRIIEVRSHEPNDLREVIVNASIADLPMANLYAHRVFHVRNGRYLGQLVGGSSRILGCICMETDILAEGVGFLQTPAVGDELFFSSAGGYNASMAWHFASGVSRDS